MQRIAEAIGSNSTTCLAGVNRKGQEGTELLWTSPKANVTPCEIELHRTTPTVPSSSILCHLQFPSGVGDLP